MVKLAELAERFGGRVRGNADVDLEAVATLEQAGPRHVAYMADRRHASVLARTSAGAVILSERDAATFTGNAWVVDNPRLCFARVAHLLAGRPRFSPGTHPTAALDAAAEIAPNVFVGAHVTVEAGAVIENGAFLGAGCYVGARARIGAGSSLAPHVFVGHDCVVGKNCVIHPGAVVGSDGFGFVRDGERWVKIPQLGRVHIGDEVEIGANTTIDRGALGDTVIGNGVKLDNLIQIAHNVHIGEHTAMAANVGVAGSTRIGKGCTIGGQAGIIDHLQIVDGVHITAGSLVTRSITKPGAYSSSLRTERASKWNRNLSRLMQLDDMGKRLRRLEQTLARLASREEP